MPVNDSMLGVCRSRLGFVVGEDLDRKGGAMKIILPSFKSMDNGKEFVVIYIVVTFCGGERLRKIRTGMPFTIGICLKKNGAQHIFGSISGNSKERKEVGDM